ncbi:MAG TPA: hypothetical protein VGU02_15355 [Gaiellaceae bacterium]|nr:hypothetical protein [Gaiellaceae bacterium]
MLLRRSERADRIALAPAEAVALPGRRARRVSAKAARMPARVTVIQPRKGGFRGALAELWLFRWCVPYFGRLYLRKRYRRTHLGFLWVPLKPSFNIASKILVFGGIVGISAGKTPYPIFFLIATASWQLFAEIALWGTRSLEVGRMALQKIELPRLPIIFAAIIPGSVEFLVYVGFAAGALLYYVIRAHAFFLTLGPESVLVLAGLVLIIFQGVGLGMVLAGSPGRDLRFSLQFGLSFMYFVTPVLYPLSKVQPQYRPLLELNPLMGSIEMVKDGLFASHELTLAASLVAVAGAVALWAIGLWRLERRRMRVAAAS